MIDTFNKWAVGVNAHRTTVTILNPPFLLSPDDALLLAAYLVALAKDTASHPFEDVLQAVQTT